MLKRVELMLTYGLSPKADKQVRPTKKMSRMPMPRRSAEERMRPMRLKRARSLTY